MAVLLNATLLHSGVSETGDLLFHETVAEYLCNSFFH